MPPVRPLRDEDWEARMDEVSELEAAVKALRARTGERWLFDDALELTDQSGHCGVMRTDSARARCLLENDHLGNCVWNDEPPFGATERDTAFGKIFAAPYGTPHAQIEGESFAFGVGRT